MKLEYIEEFVVLAEIKNFQKAAMELSMSQTALSQHIARLQEELGATLFSYEHHRVSITTQGELFLSYAKEITNSYHSYLAEARSTANNNLRVGAIQLHCAYGLHNYIAEFITSNPHIHFSIHEGDHSEILHEVSTGICDLGLIDIYSKDGTVPVLSSTFGYNLLMQDELSVMAPRSSASLKDTVEISDLKDMDFIWLPDDYSFLSSSFTPHVLYRGSPFNIANVISSKNCIAIFPSKQAEYQNRHGDVKICRIEPTLYQNLYVIYRKNSLTSSGRKFLSFIRKCFEN
jgi:DNA-binding transcriptional LysR family regulator